MRQANRSGPFGSSSGAILAAVIGALGVGVFLLGARRYLPPVASRHGVGIDTMLLYLLVTTGALVVVGHLILGYFVFRFSRGREVSSSLPGVRAERIWSIVPALMMTVIAEGGVLVIGIPVFSELYAEGPPNDAIVIEVTAEQFTWNVRYPGADGTFGRLDPALISTENPLGLDPSDPAGVDDIHQLALMYVPVNQPVRVRLRAKDVLHSFYLPYQRIKQDAVPGMTIDLWFVPTREGEFDLACAELCGFGHYQMRGFLHVVSEEEFERWLEETRG
ncbi:MAG TPA: cytochrome-c oxidase [Vicinamibacteria bacterium]|nr:cytochrome-c oxidase [Vicinamibacteria bacterium]